MTKGNPRRGLLVIDLQEDFDPSADLVAAILKAAEDFDEIVQTRFYNPPCNLYREVLDWHGDGGVLCAVPRARIFAKSGYGLTPAHLNEIKTLDCGEWHLCGLETDACVFACAFSLWDAGIRPLIRPELCASPLHAATIPLLIRQFGAFQATSESAPENVKRDA